MTITELESGMELSTTLAFKSLAPVKSITIEEIQLITESDAKTFNLNYNQYTPVPGNCLIVDYGDGERERFGNSELCNLDAEYDSVGNHKALTDDSPLK